jgi:carbon storage regulator CsrA
MLVLTRRVGQTVVIDGTIVVTVVSLVGRKIRLGFTAPEGVLVDREEVYQRRRQSPGASTNYAEAMKMTEITSSPQGTDHRARWAWFLALGVVLLLLGLAGAGASTLLELTSLLVFGPMLLASSFIQILAAFFAEKGKEAFLHLVAASLEAMLGFLIMLHPGLVVTDLVVVIAIFLMVGGLVRVVRSLVTHSPGRGWTFMAGVAALFLGACVWLRLPVSQLWFVGLCLAIDYLCHGGSWFAIALAESKPLQAPAS